MTRRPWASLALCSLPLLLLAGSVGGCQQEGFECGRVIAGTSTVRRCDRTLEICICATGSCAKQVEDLDNLPSGDAGTAGEGGEAGSPSSGPPSRELKCDKQHRCETGYRYVEAPFARKDLAGCCVPPLDMQLTPVVPSEEAPGPACLGVTIPETTLATQATGQSSTASVSSTASMSSTGEAVTTTTGSTASQSATSAGAGGAAGAMGTTGIPAEGGAGGQP